MQGKNWIEYFKICSTEKLKVNLEALNSLSAVIKTEFEGLGFIALLIDAELTKREKENKA
jgi:hypothetical protein